MAGRGREWITRSLLREDGKVLYNLHYIVLLGEDEEKRGNQLVPFDLFHELKPKEMVGN
jgi:hypothetical protein